MNTHYLDDIKSSLNFRKKTFRNVREREKMKRRKMKFPDSMKLGGDRGR